MRENAENKRFSITVLSLCVAAVLLANPIVGMLDILPDALAWLLIYFALREMAEVEPNHIIGARKQALFLTLLSVLRFVLWDLLRTSTQPSDRMLFTLVFAIGESLCMLLFFRAFFNGTDILSRNGNGMRMNTSISSVHFLCGLFTVLRAVLSLLPELTAIPSLLLEGDASGDAVLTEEEFYRMQDLASLRDLALVICFVLGLIIGVIWLTRFLPFVLQFRKDASLRAYLIGLLYDITPKRRRSRQIASLQAARLCFAFGMVFLLDFRVDVLRILPLGAFPAFFALGCLFLNRFAPDLSCRKTQLIACLTAAVLLLSEVYRRFFTVWDARVIEEQSIGIELISCAWMLVGMTLLFVFWQLFAEQAEQASQAYGCGRLYLNGLPYALLTLYALLQAAVFILPHLNFAIGFVRVAVAAVLWFVTNRRFAMLEAQVTESLSLLPQE